MRTGNAHKRLSEDGRFVFHPQALWSRDQEGTAMESITVQQLHAREGIPLIDVREPDEFAAGRVPGAVSLPMSQLGQRLDELPDGAFDVICKIGGRSARVAEALTARGYDVVNVDGGTDAWIAAGYPIES